MRFPLKPESISTLRELRGAFTASNAIADPRRKKVFFGKATETTRQAASDTQQAAWNIITPRGSFTDVAGTIDPGPGLL